MRYCHKDMEKNVCKAQIMVHDVKQRHEASAMTSWPSGLRRNVKAVVFTGVGSNPTEVTFWTI